VPKLGTKGGTGLKKFSELLPTLLVAAGGGLLTLGMGLISAAAGAITAGGLLLALGVVLALGGEDR